MIDLKKNISTNLVIGATGSAIFLSTILIGVVYINYLNILRSIPPTNPIRINYFSRAKIEAKAVVVYDVKSQKFIYQKNSKNPLPLASITKVIMALVANDTIPQNQKIVIDKSSLDIQGENGFKENQIWKFADLLNYTLLESSNDGSHAIANAASSIKGIDFTTIMNNKVKDLGLVSMKFNNDNGLDLASSTESGGYGSAEDVAKLFSHIITTEPNLLEITKNDMWTFKDLDDNLFAGKNTDLIINDIPGILASKTGYTLLAGGNLAIAFDAGLNHPIIVVVLGSSWDGRFTDVKKLVGATLNTMKQQ